MSAGNQLKSIKYQVRESIQPTIAPLSAAIGGVLAASSLQAATITVSTLDDGLISGECSLRSALYASSNNASFNDCIAGDVGEDTIEFEPGLNGTITLLPDVDNFYYDGSTLPIGESVTIEGDDRITIQGSGDAPAIYAKYDPGGFETESARINNLTITGGGGDAGGAIRSRVKDLFLTGVTLENNSVTSSGGALWHQHATSSLSRIFISGSEISGNSVTGPEGRGGGIYAGSDSQSLQISSSTVYGNTAVGSGGGIELRTGTGSLSSYGSNFGSNQAKYGDGGGINIIAGASGSAYGLSFFARDSNFYDNSSSGNGGAISIIDNGTGVNGFGGARLLGTYVTGNFAGNEGGGAWISRLDGSGTVGDPNNEILIESSDFSNRAATISGNQSAYGAGGLYLSVGDATPITISGGDISNNIANDGDGGGARIVAGSSGIQLSDTAVSANLADDSGQGGGLFVTVETGDFEARQLSLIDNTSAGAAGGMRIYADGGSVGLEYADVRGNEAITGYGGGIQVYGTPSQLGMAYSTISSNIANNAGGGLDLFIPTAESILLEVKYSELAGNSAGSRGGAVNVAAGQGSQLFLKNSTLSGNSAGTYGGGVNADNDMILELKYATVADNYAGNEGGGVYSDLANGCNVSNTIVAGNTAGAGAAAQDLRSSGVDTLCDVDDSLVSGDDSEFNSGTGNILYQDPMLGPLTNNGGVGGRTHALLDGSPAIDAGSSGQFTPDQDQRGSSFVRIFGAGLDMGAYEQQTQVDEIFSDRFESP